MTRTTSTMAASHRQGEAAPDTARLMYIAIGTLIALGLVVVAISYWSGNRISSRSDVHEAMTRLEPACRAVARLRIRARLLHEGRPLTRREVNEMTSGITGCEEINQQMAGVEDV